MITPVNEFIIGMDILYGLKMTLDTGVYQFGGSWFVPKRLRYFSVYNLQMLPVLVGKVVDEPIDIPPATRGVAMKQYRIPGGLEEIEATIGDLLEVGVLVPTTTQWNNPMWPVRKADGTWRMTVDYRELNKVTPPLHAAVPDIVTLIETIQVRKGTWYAVIDLANAFFTIPLKKKYWDQFAVTWKGRQYTFTRLPQGWVHSPTICHCVVAQHLDSCKLSVNIQTSYYIDDILVQGDSESEVATALQQVVQHMRDCGWEINPHKIQGPSQSVKFLGIHWNQGKQEITEKARQKIVEFQVPTTKQQTQQFIGLLGFWRKHIPHLGRILSPLYQVTRKKHNFEWGEMQQKVFEQARSVVQQSLSLWPIKGNVEVELQVSVTREYANWSLWQKQDGQRVPLGFWNKKLPDTAARYTPFECQLLACYWALVETEQLTIGHEVQMRPEIPIMTWVRSSPKTHRIGHAQESSIIKWKWYIQDRATTGISGLSQLHEKVMAAPLAEEGTYVPLPISGSGIPWGCPYDELSDENKRHAWFTDGSAKYIGSVRHWRSVAFHPLSGKILEATGQGQSSQYAELYAIYLVLKQQLSHAHICTDSWAVANGLTTWWPIWKQNNWNIYSKQVWGAELWKEIVHMLSNTKVTVFHVDAHVSPLTSDHLYNQQTDKLSKISPVDVVTGTDSAPIPGDSQERGSITRIYTGLGLQIPDDCYGQLSSRSSLAMLDLTVLGGVIDADYQGEIQVLLYNGSEEVFNINPGGRIAQVVIISINTTTPQKLLPLARSTTRGVAGFGSTDLQL
ncbi:uncharacterized protein LOC115469710 [Microcaecilia unicolor]|uniref:ribonuclease H n=1 Tax=Microcaecilia unicolor TaxID=1415580 RepID=A0A6P7XZN4_9AMPH|nr:uncharacterized protein LOC115469710 [Microcaecilia unicolor]